MRNRSSELSQNSKVDRTMLADAAYDMPLLDRILKGAAELFAVRGYHATGISDILDAVDVSRGALYYYIDSKETLLYTICINRIVLMNKEAEQLVDNNVKPVEKLRSLARSLLVGIADHLDEWTVFFNDYRSLSEEKRQEVLLARTEYECYWQRVFREGADSGDFCEVSSLRRKGILGMFNYAYVWMRPEGSSTAVEVADEFVDMLLSGLKSDNSISTNSL